jgi:hypothetical protein
MPFEPMKTPPPAMTPERCREVLTRWTEHTENLIEANSPSLDRPAPRSLVERAAALRHALARLAALDAAREALGYCDTALEHVAHGMVVSGLPELQARVATALAQLGGPTDAG